MGHKKKKKRLLTEAAARSPPVDAIYRPHVVHHTFVPPDMKAEQKRNRAKRYFAAD